MQIRVQTWDVINRKLLARYLFETRQLEGLLTESITIDDFLDYLDWVAERSNSVPIIAYSNGEVVGWLAFFSFIPKVGTLGRWHPIVKPGGQQATIAFELLQHSIQHAKVEGFQRLEAELTEITPQREAKAQLVQRWYEAQGMHLATEEARFERELSHDSLPTVKFSPEYELVPLSEYSNEELQAPFFDMFDNSRDRFWLDQTSEQRLDAFRFWLDRDRPFIDQATAVLVKEGEIVGVTVTRPVQEVGMVGPIGVVPGFRRQGLGRGLLAYSMHGTLNNGFSKVQLEFDIMNEPAFELYRTLGFRHLHDLRIFALTL